MLSYSLSNADAACQLECLQNQPPVHEFVGPVKIVLVDVPDDVYKKRMCISGFIAMANMMIGATVITVLYFTLSLKLPMMMNLHIILCTFGYQLCFPSAILLISNLNGASAQMKEQDRRCQHMFLQMVGLLCVSAGTVMAFMPGGKPTLIFTPHSIAGLAAYGLAAVGALNGPVLYCARYATKCGKCSRRMHAFIGILAFITSSVCFCLGLFSSKTFNAWVPMVELVYIPIIFCFLYTIIIIYSPLIKCLAKYDWLKKMKSQFDKMMSSLGKQKSKYSLKFAGPLKLLIIEPRKEYYKSVLCAIGLGLANLMIGAVNMTVFLYSVNVGDTHAVICTLAYHFFSVEAILSLNYANGWSTPMKLRHRKLVHVCLQICAMAFAISGTTLILSDKWSFDSIHGITGIITSVLGIIGLLSGPFVLFGGRILKIIHMSIGMPTFIMSSISLCFSFFTSSFKNWAHINIIIVLICFIIFYTIFIVSTVLIKCFNVI